MAKNDNEDELDAALREAVARYKAKVGAEHERQIGELAADLDAAYLLELERTARDAFDAGVEAGQIRYAEEPVDFASEFIVWWEKRVRTREVIQPRTDELDLLRAALTEALDRWEMAERWAATGDGALEPATWNHVERINPRVKRIAELRALTRRR